MQSAIPSERSETNPTVRELIDACCIRIPFLKTPELLRRCSLDVITGVSAPVGVAIFQSVSE